MNITLVNPFDPPPGDEIRPGRYAAFAAALADAGHAVTWLSSDFSHTLKRSRDIQKIPAACKAAGIDIDLAPTAPYHSNVCLARLRSHRQLARAVAHKIAAAQTPPDVVVASAPPPNVAAAAIDAAHARGARAILDVQDLWPETFARVLPAPLRWLGKLALRPMATAMRHAESAADAGIAVAEGYRQHYAARAKPGATSHVLHLGADLAEFDSAAASDLPGVPDAAKGARWILCGGMVGTALHWQFLLDLADQLADADVHILVAGTGPAETYLRDQIAARKLGNVHLLGFQPYPAFCALAARADFGLNHYRADSFVYFPNRVFDYFAADLPVINTVGGELADLLAARDAGFTTTSFDAEATAGYVKRMLAARPPTDDRPAPSARRGDWVAAFDRPAIARRLVEIVEEEQI